MPAIGGERGGREGKRIRGEERAREVGGREGGGRRERREREGETGKTGGGGGGGGGGGWEVEGEGGGKERGGKRRKEKRNITNAYSCHLIKTTYFSVRRPSRILSHYYQVLC